jgi:hypothetical protein
MDRAGNAFSVAAAASASVNNVTITRSSLASGYATITRIFNTGTAPSSASQVLLDCLCSGTCVALSTSESCLPIAMYYTHCTALHTLHYTAQHYTALHTLHYTHCTAQHYTTHTALHCTAQHSTTLHTLHYTAQHSTTHTALHCTAQHYATHTALHCTALHYTTLYYTTLHCTALHCTTLHCPTLTALYYTALHCTALPPCVSNTAYPTDFYHVGAQGRVELCM